MLGSRDLTARAQSKVGTNGIQYLTHTLGQSPTHQRIPQGTIVGILRPYELHIKGYYSKGGLN